MERLQWRQPYRTMDCGRWLHTRQRFRKRCLRIHRDRYSLRKFRTCVGLEIAEGGNSGMLYHVVENPKFKVPYVTGPEYQLLMISDFPSHSKTGKNRCRLCHARARYFENNHQRPANGTLRKSFSIMDMSNIGSTARKLWNSKHGPMIGSRKKQWQMERCTRIRTGPQRRNLSSRSWFCRMVSKYQNQTNYPARPKKWIFLTVLT